MIYLQGRAKPRNVRSFLACATNEKQEREQKLSKIPSKLN